MGGAVRGRAGGRETLSGSRSPFRTEGTDGATAEKGSRAGDSVWLTHPFSTFAMVAAGGTGALALARPMPEVTVGSRSAMEDGRAAVREGADRAAGRAAHLFPVTALLSPTERAVTSRISDTGRRRRKKEAAVRWGKRRPAPPAARAGGRSSPGSPVACGEPGGAFPAREPIPDRRYGWLHGGKGAPVRGPRGGVKVCTFRTPHLPARAGSVGRIEVKVRGPCAPH